MTEPDTPITTRHSVPPDHDPENRATIRRLRVLDIGFYAVFATISATYVLLILLLLGADALSTSPHEFFTSVGETRNSVFDYAYDGDLHHLGDRLDVGGNTGWIFAIASQVSGAESCRCDSRHPHRASATGDWPKPLDTVSVLAVQRVQRLPWSIRFRQ